jgi:hypothetical protein
VKLDPILPVWTVWKNPMVATIQTIACEVIPAIACQYVIHSLPPSHSLPGASAYNHVKPATWPTRQKGIYHSADFCPLVKKRHHE